MSTSLRAYRRRATLIPVLLLAYPLLAVLGPRHGRAEFYPFFSWNLFSHSVPIRNDAVLLVKEVDGASLERPTAFYDLGHFFAAAKSKDIRLAKMIDNLVYAERVGDQALSDRLLEVIRSTFLSEAKSAVFEIAVITYNPVERYRTGKITGVKVLKSAEKHK
jgi:hypothetical protein